ncbi:hypothetical protein Hypma_004945 [Hypsizygus marmoreus]|uniref:Uncharacterized protein n=1 Tax=Hypsizygus marmoreus TaxID=39966 RepID=A0A369K0P1_HYPMA|nr:hypothetical protein Hypma_004945 [Hypsizygus marmoreus]
MPDLDINERTSPPVLHQLPSSLQSSHTPHPPMHAHQAPIRSLPLPHPRFAIALATPSLLSLAPTRSATHTFEHKTILHALRLGKGTSDSCFDNLRGIPASRTGRNGEFAVVVSVTLDTLPFLTFFPSNRQRHLLQHAEFTIQHSNSPNTLPHDTYVSPTNSSRSTMRAYRRRDLIPLNTDFIQTEYKYPSHPHSTHSPPQPLTGHGPRARHIHTLWPRRHDIAHMPHHSRRREALNMLLFTPTTYDNDYVHIRATSLRARNPCTQHPGAHDFVTTPIPIWEGRQTNARGMEGRRDLRFEA